MEGIKEGNGDDNKERKRKSNKEGNRVGNKKGNGEGNKEGNREGSQNKGLLLLSIGAVGSHFLCTIMAWKQLDISLLLLLLLLLLSTIWQPDYKDGEDDSGSHSIPLII